MKLRELISEAPRVYKQPDTDLQKGERVHVDLSKEKNYPGGHTHRTGKIAWVGQKGVTIHPDDGGEKEWHPFKIVKRLNEAGDAGGTTSSAITSVPNPHIAIGKKRGNKSYTGTPGHSGKHAPKPPKIVQPKNKDGTAKNGADLKGTSLFGGPALKR
jgi:hypothetical protein